MKQKTAYQKPEIQHVMALTAGGFATSVIMNAKLHGATSSDENKYVVTSGSWE